MERGSKHGPLHDEAMADEVEGLVRSGHSTRAEEWHDPEPPGEGQPEPDLAPDTTLTGGVPEGLTPEDVERRAELASYLGKEVYPANRQVLVDTAQRNGAPDRVLAALQRLPDGREFAGAAEVWEAVGGGAEEHRF